MNDLQFDQMMEALLETRQSNSLLDRIETVLLEIRDRLPAKEAQPERKPVEFVKDAKGFVDLGCRDTKVRFIGFSAWLCNPNPNPSGEIDLIEEELQNLVNYARSQGWEIK